MLSNPTLHKIQSIRMCQCVHLDLCDGMYWVYSKFVGGYELVFMHAGLKEFVLIVYLLYMCVLKSEEKIKDIISKTRTNPRRRLQYIYDIAKTKSICEGADTGEKRLDIEDMDTTKVCISTFSVCLIGVCLVVSVGLFGRH